METRPQGARGPTIDVFELSGGRSLISGTASRGALLTFFALMVGPTEPLAPPPRGPTVDVFCINGGSSQTSHTTSQGGHRRCFLR
jgi:hypothetical protein